MLKVAHLSLSTIKVFSFKLPVVRLYSKTCFPFAFALTNLMDMEVMQGSGNERKRSTSGSHIKSIGTHDGKFHCDEVLACFMLRLLPEYSNAQIIRTRDEEILRTCDIVVDVGGVYDQAQFRFDHHQKSFKESMSSIRPEKSWVTKLSSAGLIFCHFGERILAQVLEKNRDDEAIAKIFDKLYENFVEEIDAQDNGISLNDYPMRYRITTTLSQRVGRLNPTWRDANPNEWQCFQKALQIVGEEFLELIHHFASDWWESYSVVKTAFETRYEVDGSGEIVEFPCGGVPWKDHLAKLEKESGEKTLVKFVIFSDGKGMWRVQAVPITPDSFILRIPLLEEWRGLRGKELEDISGIPTISFVHANGFIGGAGDKLSAILMAKRTLQNVGHRD
jgi:uncharacterized UPF0160 family protein